MERSKRALVVDDENLVLKIISDILAKEGYEVKAALDCDGALGFLKKEPFHVVLTDIRMPEKNGIDLLERIRTFNPDIPVIIMTGFASLETAVAALQHGAFDYLIKPLDYNKLKSIVKIATHKYELVQENKRLLKELRELNSSLELKVRERTRDLENILNSTQESILTANKQLVIKSANSRTANVFGKDCIGLKLSELFPGIDFELLIPQIFSDVSYSRKEEVRYEDKFLEVRISPLVDFEDREIFGVIAVIEDITEKKKLQVQLIQSAKMSAVGQLAAGIAHEFNNILTGILGYTSFAMSRTDIEQIKRDLKVVEKAGNRAAEIVKKLLSFSRQKEEEFQLVKIEEVIEDGLALTEHTLKLEGIEIVRRYGEIPPIRINSGEMQQVILNLAINSKHAMPEGGTITVSTGLEGDYVRINFSDTGMGIPKENLPRIFEPFFTTKEGQKSNIKSGTGLGLYMTYAIVGRHGGRIDVSSEIGKGTTFTIRIPNVQQLPSTSGNGLLHGENKNRVVRPKKKGSILVVDDEEFICDIFKESLSEVNHNVVTASSGEDAIELVQKNHYDIVFLDLTMPGKSGLDVLKEIRVLDPNSMVVIISGRIEENVSNQLINAGAFSFIHKPFTLDQIQHTVSRILEGE